MSTSLTHTLTVAITAALSEQLALSKRNAPVSISEPLALSQGTGASQADLMYAGTRTLAAGANETLDLTSGLTDLFGNALVFAKCRGIYVKNKSATLDLTIGAAASNAFTGPLGGTTPTMTIKAGDNWGQPCKTGWTVDGTHKSLKFAMAAGSGNHDYDLILVGTSV